MKLPLKDGIHSFDSSCESLEIWNRFVHESPSAGFYHRFEWKCVNENEFGHRTYYLASVSNGGIDGILPMVLIRSRLFGNILCSLPFLNFCGPSSNTIAAETALLQHAYQIAEQEGVDYFEIRSLRVCDSELPMSSNKVSMTVPLASDPDLLWDAFTSKHRNNIRRAYKSGLHVKSGNLELLDTYYDLLSRSWRDLGTPVYKKSYFESILREFGEKVRIFVAFQGDTPVATAFNGHGENTVEGMWAGSPYEYRKLQSNYVLYWEMIKRACEEGYERFHLGRSSVESGGESFKKKWGADTQQLFWQYYLPNGGNMPQLNVQNPKYQLAIKAWRRMPLRATKVIGPLIARCIP